MFKKINYLVCLVLLLASCGSRLDRPENEVLMLDPVKNPKLKITVAAFLGSAPNLAYLKQHCEALPTENGNVRYLKDSSAVLLKNGEVLEAAMFSEGDFLNYGLKIGMTKADFQARFHDLRTHDYNPFIALEAEAVAIGCCTAAGKVWRFEFEEARLKRILFE